MQREAAELGEVYDEIDQEIGLSEEGPAPFDLAAASVSDLLDSEPPPIEWAVVNRLPVNVVALLAAMGGTGKSMAVLELAISLCSGLRWLGMEIGRTGSVMILGAEEDRQESHRRLRRVSRYYREITTESEWERAEELIRERLFIFDRVGEDNRLTARIDRELIRTGLADRIIATARELPGVVAIVLDPLARFDGGDPNDNSDSTRLIEAAEYIRRETGALVLLTHHVSKAGIKDPESGQEAVRGGSGLVDGARWVGILHTLRRDSAKDFGVDPDDAGQYVRFTTPKANYSAPWPGMWLERQAGGVLAPTELEPVQRQRKAGSEEDRYHDLLPKLRDLVRHHQEKGRPLTRNQLRNMAGRSGPFGVGDQTLRGIIERAVMDGYLTEHETGDRRRGVELRTW